eukprot:7742191-Lingulodinium_polyedra.AAC.1
MTVFRTVGWETRRAATSIGASAIPRRSSWPRTGPARTQWKGFGAEPNACCESATCEPQRATITG